MITRRCFTNGAGLALVMSGLWTRPRAAAAAAGWAAGIEPALRQAEADSGGRLGVAILDTLTGERAGHRTDERFPLCSTFKALAASALLARVDAGQEQLSRRIRFTAADLVSNSPVTKDHAGGEGMTLAEICAAAITFSDNTAGNLMLAQIGGPAGLTRYVRSIGDEVTRLDRMEPDLNEALPGDPRDTTTPAAMLANLRNLTLGDALSPASRNQLIAWLKANTTGATRLRAGLPKGWVVGDKTGSGDRGTANDVGVIWPPERKPVLVAVYLTGTSAPAEQRSAAIAAVGQAIATTLTG